MSSAGEAHLALPAVRSDRFISSAVPYSTEYWQSSSGSLSAPTSHAMASAPIMMFCGARRSDSFCSAPSAFWRAMLSAGSARKSAQS
eukprot:scaffold6454_cov113-Isochrysis_galbana.AAC.11